MKNSKVIQRGRLSSAFIVACFIVLGGCNEQRLENDGGMDEHALESDCAANVSPTNRPTREALIVCGNDPATAELFDSRMQALQTLTGRCAVPIVDARVLLSFIVAKSDALRGRSVPKIAKIRDGVISLLLSQKVDREEIAAQALKLLANRSDQETDVSNLIRFLRDLCNDSANLTLRDRIISDLLEFAREYSSPDASTALNAVSLIRELTPEQESVLRNVTVGVFSGDYGGGEEPSLMVMAEALSVAGHRQYKEVLPALRIFIERIQTMPIHREAAFIQVFFAKSAFYSIGRLGSEEDLPLLEKFLIPPTSEDKDSNDVPPELVMKELYDMSARQSLEEIKERIHARESGCSVGESAGHDNADVESADEESDFRRH